MQATELTIEDAIVLSVITRPMTLSRATMLAMEVAATPQMHVVLIIDRIHKLTEQGMLYRPPGCPGVEPTKKGSRELNRFTDLVRSLNTFFPSEIRS